MAIGASGSFEEVDAWLTSVPGKAARGAEQGLIKLGLLVFNESQKLVPVDTGLLRGSGQFEAVGNGFNAVFWIIYAPFYAVYVHEDLSKYHKPPTQAKYVETPLRRYKPAVPQIVGMEMYFAIVGKRYTTTHKL